ncbi:MAG: hypothetical protein FJ087_21125 [Deltaproteobacteria bacterium]|nr:hypothetical protein [Deltaproteobacteria bacterium]
MSRLSKLSPAVAAILVAAPGCKSMYDDPAGAADATDTAPEAVRFDGGGVGATCAATPDCREGLACAGGKCAPAGDRGLDKRCILSAECAGPSPECPNGLSCSWFGFCACAGAGGEGAPCTSSSDCAKGLACAAVGFSGYCEPRPDAGGDLDAPCADSKTCMAGLVCSAASKTCVPASLLLNPDLFPGVACPDESKTPFGVRMRLPRGDEPGEFYSLPFPTDVRRKADGHVDLHDHPRPGGGVFGVDPLDGILRAIEAEIAGYPLDAAVYFRFTRPVDPATVRTAADPASGAPATVRFVDLDDPARAVPFVARAAADRNKYICANRLYVHPVWSKPLRPNVRYAVVVTSGVRSLAAAGAQAPAHLDDLDMLLGEARPGGDAEGRAWDAFAPLRAWMKPAGVAAADVAGATVFTTGDPTAPLRAMGAFFHPAAGTQPAADMPVLTGAVECGEGKDLDACATPGWAATEAGKAGGADPRACPAAKPPGWTEYHARIRLPVFQEGDAPYLAGGGAIRTDAGKPVVVRYEDVCAAFAIPDGDEPDDGWPLLTYGHGTGGSFANGMAWAATLAPQGIAVLSIDQPMHGPRRGIDRDPGPLFYNFLNPPAARGNLIQGAADNFSLVRFAAAFDGKIATRQVRFDRDRIAYMGHSQGATTGPLFVPWEDGGGSWARSSPARAGRWCSGFSGRSSRTTRPWASAGACRSFTWTRRTPRSRSSSGTSTGPTPCCTRPRCWPSPRAGRCTSWTWSGGTTRTPLGGPA